MREKVHSWYEREKDFRISIKSDWHFLKIITSLVWLKSARPYYVFALRLFLLPAVLFTIASIGIHFANAFAMTQFTEQEIGLPNLMVAIVVLMGVFIVGAPLLIYAVVRWMFSITVFTQYWLAGSFSNTTPLLLKQREENAIAVVKVRQKYLTSYWLYCSIFTVIPAFFAMALLAVKAYSVWQPSSFTNNLGMMIDFVFCPLGCLLGAFSLVSSFVAIPLSVSGALVSEVSVPEVSVPRVSVSVDSVSVDSVSVDSVSVDSVSVDSVSVNSVSVDSVSVDSVSVDSVSVDSVSVDSVSVDSVSVDSVSVDSVSAVSAASALSGSSVSGDATSGDSVPWLPTSGASASQVPDSVALVGQISADQASSAQQAAWKAFRLSFKFFPQTLLCSLFLGVIHTIVDQPELIYKPDAWQAVFNPQNNSVKVVLSELWQGLMSVIFVPLSVVPLCEMLRSVVNESDQIVEP